MDSDLDADPSAASDRDVETSECKVNVPHPWPYLESIYVQVHIVGRVHVHVSMFTMRAESHRMFRLQEFSIKPQETRSTDASFTSR